MLYYRQLAKANHYKKTVVLPGGEWDSDPFSSAALQGGR